MSCGTTILTIAGLRVSLCRSDCPDRHLVSDLSLQVRRGRVTGLIGESGSGKSLTCLAVMDLLPKAMRQSGGRIDPDRSTGPNLVALRLFPWQAGGDDHAESDELL